MPTARSILNLWLCGLCCCALLLTGCNTTSSANLSGLTMFEQGNYPAADAYFRQAIQSNPNDPDAYYNLAATYHRLAKQSNRPVDFQQAESFYQQCLARNPNHADCYRGLAVLLAEQNKPDAAFAMLQRWGQYSPTRPEPFIELARFNEEFGNKAQAQDALVAAIRNDPNNAKALAALGRLREEAGDQYQALQNYQRALAANPNMPDLAQRVAMLQSRGVPTHPQYGSYGGRLAAQPNYFPANDQPGFR
jgi:tetratricopeptide (TPR) repeat protein